MEIQGIKLALDANDADDGDRGRQIRGALIAGIAAIKKTPVGYRVPSQSNAGTYIVSVDDEPFCSCPDFERRQQPCKHYYSVLCLIQREELPDGTVKETTQAVSVKYTQDWPAYNAAQMNEGDYFLKLYRSLCDTVEQPPQTTGRPRLNLADALYGLGIRVFSTMSARRAMFHIGVAKERGLLNRNISATSIFRYMEDPSIKPVLRHLITMSALPLVSVERNFAIDGTGFSTNVYDSWEDTKWGKKKSKSKFLMAQVLCGVKTNIVAVADVDTEQTGDAPHLNRLLTETMEYFDVQQLSADKGYLSANNLLAIKDKGVLSFIPFKDNSVIHKNPKKAADETWNRLLNYYRFHRAEFDEHYHRRSNVESTMRMIKAKFGGNVRSKNPEAQENEALLKILCHNIACLVSSMYELGIPTPTFDEGVRLESREIPVLSHVTPTPVRLPLEHPSFLEPMRAVAL